MNTFSVLSILFGLLVLQISAQEYYNEANEPEEVSSHQIC